MLDAEHPFACVLLDQDLPDLQGLDVLEDIRERANPPPVVMLTGEGRRRRIDRGAAPRCRGLPDEAPHRRRPSSACHPGSDRAQCARAAIARQRAALDSLLPPCQSDRGRAVHRRCGDGARDRMQRGRAQSPATGAFRWPHGQSARRVRQPRVVAGVLPSCPRRGFGKLRMAFPAGGWNLRDDRNPCALHRGGGHAVYRRRRPRCQRAQGARAGPDRAFTARQLDRRLESAGVRRASGRILARSGSQGSVRWPWS